MTQQWIKPTIAGWTLYHRSGGSRFLRSCKALECTVKDAGQVNLPPSPLQQRQLTLSSQF